MRNKEVNYQVKKYLPTLTDEEHVRPNLVCFLHQRSFHEHLFSELSVAQLESYPAGSDLIVLWRTEEPPCPSSVIEMIIRPFFCMMQRMGAGVTVVGTIVDAMNTIFQTTEAASEEGLYDRSNLPVGLQRS